jgi:hypothetical protein
MMLGLEMTTNVVYSPLTQDDPEGNLIGNDCFSVDVFYLILQFVTKSFTELLRVKGICRNWKYLVETSPIWCIVEVQLFPPLQFLREVTHRPELFNEVTTKEEKEKRILERFPESKCTLVIGDGEARFPNVYRVTMSNAKTTTELTENIFVKAKSVHDTFLATFKGYQRKWQNFRRWKVFIDVSINVQGTTVSLRWMSVLHMWSINFLLNPAQSLLEKLLLTLRLDSRRVRKWNLFACFYTSVSWLLCFTVEC